MSPESSLSKQLAAAQDHIRHLSGQLAAEREATQHANAQWQRQIEEQAQQIAQLTAQIQSSEATPNRQTDQSKLLWDMTQQIRQALDVDVVMETGVDQVRHFFGVDRAVIYRFLSDWSGAFVAESVADPWVKMISPEMNPVWADTCLQENQGSRFQRHELLAVPNIYQAGFQPCHVEVLERLQAKAFVVAPIFAGNQLWGLLAIYQNTATRSWQDQELALLQQVAGQLGIALHQASLYEQAQAELQQRQQVEAVLRFQLGAIEAAADGIALLQGDRFIYSNSAHGRLFGYETTDLIGQSWDQLHSPEVVAQMEQEMRPILRQEKFWQGEVLATRRDGSTFPAFLSLTLLDDGMVVAICRDMTQEKQATQALQTQQRFIEHAIQTNPDLLVFLFDVPRQSLLFVSESVANLLDYTAEEVLAMGAEIVSRMVHPDDQARFAAYLEQVDRSQPGESLSLEYRVGHRDGRWLNVLLRGSVHTRDDQGHLQQLLGSVTDITSRRQTEANLEASEARFETLANLVPDFLWESELDGYNTWCNQRWLDYTGQTLEQALGRGWLEAIHPEDRAPSLLIQQNAATTGEFRRGERRVRRHDGEYRWFASHISPIKNAAGEVIKLYGAVTDVHETRMALETLQRSAEINAFRVKLSDVLRSLTQPRRIQSEACRLLGEQLGADRVFYAALDEVAGTAHLKGEYRRDGSDSLLGEYPLADYPWSLPHLRRGETIVMPNTQATPVVTGVAKARLGEAQLVSLIAIPLIQEETLGGVLVASQAVAHEWTAAEVVLVSETAERLWTAIHRAEAEAAVKDLSERLALALKVGSIGTWDWDCVNEVKWDEQMYALYGLPPGRERAIYQTWRNCLHPDDRDRVEALLQAAVRGEAVYDTEFRIVRPDGEPRWIQAVAQVQTDDQGNPIRVVGINQDITERKNAEVALQEQTSRLTLALEAGAYGVGEWHLANPGNWDEQTYHIYGLQDLGRPVTYQDWYDLLHPDDASQVEAALAQAAETRNVLNAEFRIVRPDGELRWLEIFAQAQCEAENTPVRMVGINKDITHRKAAEAELQLLANRLSLALLAGQIGFWLWDLNQSLFWDPSLCRIYGLPDVEQVTDWQTWRDLVHPEDLDRVEALLQAAIHGEPYLGTEFRIWRPDGELRWIQSSAYVQRDEAGQAIQMIGINQDITARKQAELSLQDQTRRLTLALKAGAYGIWEWDLVVVPLWEAPVYWDAQIYQDYGLHDLGRPVTNQDWQGSVHPEDILWVKAQLEADIQARRPHSVEYRIRRPNGELRWVLATAKLYCDDQGQPLRLVGIHQDITSRKLAEQELLNSRAKFQRLVDDIGDKFVVFSHTGTLLTYASGGLQSVFGVPPEAVLDQPWGETIQWLPETLTLAQEQVQNLLTERPPSQEFEMSFIRPDGAVRTLHVVQHPVWDEVGNLLAVEGVVEDITERKATETALRRTNAELERATRLKDEFLANMSHELRTPLNAILGMTEGLQEEVFGPLTEPQQRSLDTIQRSSSHLLSLINDILDLSKIEAGQIELDFSPVNVSLLCRASITFIKQQAHKKQQHLTTLIPETLPDLYGDDRRLRQVLINLLTNAVKFTPEGGQITLSASYTALSADEAQSWLAHPQATPSDTLGWVSIAITDTGIGISPDDAKRLFQPFMQVNTALNRQHEGTGLGLALVKRIVEAHGGEITLTSEPGQGSCFTAQFPIVAIPGATSPYREASTALVDPPSADLASAPLVLIAEDNEANIHTASTYLEAKGYQIIVAHNGLEAVEMAATAQPDIILMDIQMPHLDGLEAIRQIRQNPTLATVPIVALTALAMPNDEERCLEAGATAYLSKPIRLKQLAQVIATLTGTA